MNEKFMFTFNVFTLLGLVISASCHPYVRDDVPGTALRDVRNSVSLSRTARSDPVMVALQCNKDLLDIVVRGMICTCDVNSRYIKVRDDYEYFGGIGAFKLHTTGETFSSARKICEDEGAHLAIINSEDEEKILVDIFKGVSSNDFSNVVSTGEARVGLHDMYEEGEWVTVQGDSHVKTGYTKWGVTSNGVKQPDNSGNEDCAALMIHENDSGMNDVSCDLRYAFFCEISENSIG